MSFSITYSFEDENMIDIIDIINTVKYIFYLYYGFCLINYCGIFSLRLVYNQNYYSYDYIVFIIGIGYIFLTLLSLLLISIIIFIIKEFFVCTRNTLALCYIAIN